MAPPPAATMGRMGVPPVASSAFLSPSIVEADRGALPAASGVGPIRFMSKYLSKSRTKRLPLTTKKAGKGFYKGNGATKEGHRIKGGKFRLDPEKMLQLMIPDLEGFKLKPYIASGVPRTAPENRPPPPGPGAPPQQIPLS